jgi:hypothetical protein
MTAKSRPTLVCNIANKVQGSLTWVWRSASTAVVTLQGKSCNAYQTVEPFLMLKKFFRDAAGDLT